MDMDEIDQEIIPVSTSIQSQDLIAFLRLNHAKELAMNNVSTSGRLIKEQQVSNGNNIEDHTAMPKVKVIKRPKDDGNLGPCSVCESPNSGFHFGATACAACSAFFRRTISENRKYACRKTGDGYLNCPIDQQHRCYCRACRLQKCLSMGMEPCAVQPHRDSIGAKLGKRSSDEDSPKSTKKSSMSSCAMPILTPASLPPVPLLAIDDSLVDQLSRTKPVNESITVLSSKPEVSDKCSTTAQLLSATNTIAEQLMALSRSPVVSDIRDQINNHQMFINSQQEKGFNVIKQEESSPEPQEPTPSHSLNHNQQAYDFLSLSTIYNMQNGLNQVDEQQPRGSESPSVRSFSPANSIKQPYDSRQNIIELMVESYRLMLERRRLIYCPGSLKDLLGGTLPTPRPAKLYDRVRKEKLRVEISFYIEFLNSIHPFPKLQVDDRVSLMKHLSLSFSILEKYYVTMRGGGLQTNRIIHGDGTFTDLDNPDSIETSTEKMDRDTLIKLFVQPLRDSLHEISGPMFHSQMSDVEFCALIAVLLFDPSAPGLEQSTRRIVKDARDKVYQDWFAYYAHIGRDDASERVGNTMLLLPAVQSAVEKTQEYFHLIRVFELFEYDSILNDMFDTEET